MKTPVCQSCGMPMTSPQMRGTDAHGQAIEDYCKYCYRYGQFTQNVTMEEMICLCANYVSGNSRERAVAGMRKQFPTLKRWARKEETEHEHHKSINRVLEYVREHLDENTDLRTLASVANISPFHFHRIFKTVIGESLSEYTQRIRLEYVADRLKNSGLAMAELAERTGYSSAQALSRAFKKHFNLPPTAFRSSFLEHKFSRGLLPRVCRLASKYVMVLRQYQGHSADWKKLYTYAMFRRILSESTQSIGVIEKGRVLPAVTAGEDTSEDKIERKVILPEGIYAIFTHKGDPDGITELYSAAVEYWLPKSKYRLAPSLPYINYLNGGLEVQPENLLTEIYLPLSEK